jgi:hypothetical protein
MNSKEPATASDAINAEGEAPNPDAKSAINDALARFEARNAPQYDGLNGQLPDWMPPPLKHEFNAVRDRLLDSESIDDVQNWMGLWRSPTADGWMYVPPEYDRDIDSLVYIQSIVNLGPEAGIDAYLGKGGMEVVRGTEVVRDLARVDYNREVAKRPRPDGLNRVILNLLRQRPDGEPAGPYVERRLRELAEVRAQVDGVTIEGTEDEAIQWSDARTKTGNTALSGLKDRVSRALDQLQKGKAGLKDSR